MKNPFYEAPAAAPDPEYEHNDALGAVERYLRSSKPYETVKDEKLRRVHPDLADDEVWASVVEKLGLQKGEPAPAAPSRKRRRG